MLHHPNDCVQLCGNFNKKIFREFDRMNLRHTEAHIEDTVVAHELRGNLKSVQRYYNEYLKKRQLAGPAFFIAAIEGAVYHDVYSVLSEHYSQFRMSDDWCKIEVFPSRLPVNSDQPLMEFEETQDTGNSQEHTPETSDQVLSPANLINTSAASPSQDVDMVESADFTNSPDCSNEHSQEVETSDNLISPTASNIDEFMDFEDSASPVEIQMPDDVPPSSPASEDSMDMDFEPNSPAASPCNDPLFIESPVESPQMVSFIFSIYPILFTSLLSFSRNSFPLDLLFEFIPLL